MRILYVTNESPIFPAGGIGTYIQYAAQAMRDLGHEVFLLTWTYDQNWLVEDYAPFDPDRVRVLAIRGSTIWRQFPEGPYNLALGNLLRAEIETAVRDWQIDVVEATDFLSPAFAFFQDWQSRTGRRDLLCVTYNHGFIEDFYDADQIRPTAQTQNDLTGERQQMRISDLIITPSVTALRRLASHDIRENVSLVREPYVFASLSQLTEVADSLSYLGRISISKGIDKLILFANLIDDMKPLSSVLLIGKTVNTPFRTYEMKDYILNRLKPRLRERVFLTGQLKRDVALSLIRPGSISPSLGSAETFSYACIETIDRGLLPVVRAGTPMAEFFPEHLARHVLPENLGTVAEVRRIFEGMLTEAPSIVRGVQEANEAALDPARIAETMTDEYDAALRAKRRFRVVPVRNPAGIRDVTVLMPVHKPENIFLETVESLAAQTSGPPRVIICDDGTPDQHRFWFDYAAMRLPEVTVIRQPNSGLLGARQTLITAAASRLSIFLDADDILDPGYIERLLDAWNGAVSPPQAVLTQRWNFHETDEVVLRHLQHDHIHMLRNDYRMTALIETDVLREIGFDMTRRNGEADDWVFWLEFSAAGHVAIMVPDALFRYRFRTGSMSWPWSMGQSAGSNSMVRQALASFTERRPESAATLARALFSRENQDG